MAGIKSKVSEWLLLQLDENGLGSNQNREALLGKDENIEFGLRDEEDIEKLWADDFVHDFDGFPEQLTVYLDEVMEGISVGYRAVRWDGPSTPIMTKKHRYLVTWDEFDNMSAEERHEVLIDRLVRTINARKRHYRKCQFCGERTAKEHRFDENTCHTCATTHFGVVY